MAVKKTGGKNKWIIDPDDAVMLLIDPQSGLIQLVRDMEQYVELSRRLFRDNTNVKAFKTLVAMDRVKVGMTVPVDEA